MGVDESVPLLQIDANDATSLQSMVDKAKVILTTVGNIMIILLIVSFLCHWNDKCLREAITFCCARGWQALTNCMAVQWSKLVHSLELIMLICAANLPGCMT